MTDHPSTYRGENTSTGGTEWQDRASIHKKDDGQGIFDGGKALHRGTLAEMVRLFCNMSPATQAECVIQKAGDRMLSPGEIRALAESPNFPASQ